MKIQYTTGYSVGVYTASRPPEEATYATVEDAVQAVRQLLTEAAGEIGADHSIGQDLGRDLGVVRQHA